MGVWIEILTPWFAYIWVVVTPFVGVWIEIFLGQSARLRISRHSLCGSVDWNIVKAVAKPFPCGHSLCGSVDWNYPNDGEYRGNIWSHSLCGSVDWNIPIEVEEIVCDLSLPLWECGLKYLCEVGEKRRKESLPLRECGLKFPAKAFQLFLLLSLPLRECGLKSSCGLFVAMYIVSLPLRECGLKSPILYRYIPAMYCHSLCGSVDWNMLSLPLQNAFARHSLCGSVDWNDSPAGSTPRG